MKRHYITIVILLLCIANLYSQSSLDDILLQIEKNNPTLIALQNENQAIKQTNNTGLNLPDPEIGFAYMWGQPGDVRDKINVDVSQSFDFATLSGAKRRVANSQNKISDSEYRIQRQNILNEAQQTLISLTYCNALAQLYNSRIKQIEQLSKMTDDALHSGESTVLIANQIRLELLTLENESKLNEVERNSLLLNLQRLNGGLSIDYNSSEFPAQTLPDSFTDWYDMAAAKSPQLQYSRDIIELGSQQLSLTKSENLPSFSIGYVNELMKGDNHHGVKLGLSIPLWSNSGKIKAAKASLLASEAKMQDSELQFQANLLSQYEKAKALQKIAAEYSSAVDTYDNSKYLETALEQGYISAIYYINGLQTYFDAKIKALEAEKNYHLQLASLYAVML